MRLISIIRCGVLVLSAVVFNAGCSSGAGAAPQAPQCAQPNRLASIGFVALADEPPIAAQQGIVGAVSVRVTLDVQSKVTTAVVIDSPSLLLNSSALKAARRSTYQTAIANCFPITSSLVIVFRYPVVPLPLPPPSP